MALATITRGEVSGKFGGRFATAVAATTMGGSGGDAAGPAGWSYNAVKDHVQRDGQNAPPKRRYVRRSREKPIASTRGTVSPVSTAYRALRAIAAHGDICTWMISLLWLRRTRGGVGFTAGAGGKPVGYPDWVRLPARFYKAARPSIPGRTARARCC